MLMASSLPIPELTFFSSQITLKRRVSVSRNSLSRFSPSRNFRRNLVALRTRIRAVKEEGVLVEEEDREFINEVNGVGLSGNGVASTSGDGYIYNGSVERYTNGGVIEIVNDSSNGSLVNYASGNGVAAEVVDEIKGSELKEENRKKRVEEIGKEEAWFKSGREQVEVLFSDVNGFCMNCFFFLSNFGFMELVYSFTAVSDIYHVFLKF